MFSGCWQDFSWMFSGCSDWSCGPGRIWWSFQMKVWTLMIQRNLMIPSYSMIPAIRWSIGSMDFDNPKVQGDTSIILMVLFAYETKSLLLFFTFKDFTTKILLKASLTLEFLKWMIKVAIQIETKRLIIIYNHISVWNQIGV